MFITQQYTQTHNMQDFSPEQDVITSTETANAMGMHPWEIASNPELASKFKDISSYFAPFSDKTFLIQKLTRGMTKENVVDHVWKYVSLRKDHSATKEKMDALTKELAHYEQ